MAEPAGIFIEIPMNDRGLKQWFATSLSHNDETHNVGHILAALFHAGDPRGEVMIVHYDRTQKTLLFAWVLPHFSQEAIAPIWPILDVAAKHMAADQAQGIIATTTSEIMQTIHVSLKGLTHQNAQGDSSAPYAVLFEKFWGFANKSGAFPDAKKAMRIRGYQCAPMKKAWTVYVKWKAEKDLPLRIAAANPETPVHLFDQIYAWPGHVVERSAYYGRDIKFEGANPVGFRKVSPFFADDTHVWERCLAPHSPPEMIQGRLFPINNPDAIWEYHIVDAVDGGAFTWIHDRHDTIYWTDKRHVYACANGRLQRLNGINPGTYKLLNQRFMADGDYLYAGTTALPMHPCDVQIHDGLIWDQKHVYAMGNSLPLKGASFQILDQISKGGVARHHVTDGVKTGYVDFVRGELVEG